MAHGNISDLVFLCLLAVMAQLCFFPASLYEDIGPFKAQFTDKSADMDAIIKFTGVLFLMLGLTFSGVKWNPINGKMAGFGGLVAIGYFVYSSTKACFETGSGPVVLRPLLVYVVVLTVGLLHILVFPSNPLPPKTPETKNNHGNSSDLVAFSLIAASLTCFFYPDHLFQDIGPLKAQFKKSAGEDLAVMIKLAASLLLTFALILSGVKWNPINGKMACLGGFIAAGSTAYATFKADSDTFVPRIFYIYALVIFLAALHIGVFPSNPLPPKAEKSEKKA